MKALHVVTCCVILFSCSNGSDDDFEDPSDYNDRIEEGIERNACWTQSPVEIATHLFGPHDHERSFSLSYQASDEGVRVEVTREGLQDDSVRGERRLLLFEQIDGRWEISKISLTVRCYEARGHDDYSTKPCS
jgi:hypothetical protein